MQRLWDPANTSVNHPPRGQLNGARCIYDLIYNPSETKLMREARQVGCETLGGMEMLVAQAKLQFELWRVRKPVCITISPFGHKVLPNGINQTVYGQNCYAQFYSRAQR